ncbi:thiolase family protein [Candidatus Giovannonibacteria bacterium]|nr:thiolase family protein [Candidatus Giovannonibacteria bacterium]
MGSYIVKARRTPIFRVKKRWSSYHADEFGAAVIKDILGAGEMLPDLVIMGAYAQAKENPGNRNLRLTQNPAKEACIKAGYEYLSAMTVGKVCSSGLLAIMLGDAMISSENAECILAGGMENQLQFSPAVRAELLQDPFTGEMTWDAGEWCARDRGITRRDQDDWTWSSYQKAKRAVACKKFNREILPFWNSSEDEEPGRDISYINIFSAQPLSGCATITALNSSKIAAAAAGVLLANSKTVEQGSCEPLAEIVGFASYAMGGNNKKFAVAPSFAIRRVLEKTNLKIKDIGLFEINAAFASIVLNAIRCLPIDPDKVNIRGDSISFGHPIGATGAILVVKMAHMLIDLGLRYGVVSLCNTPGEATAMILKNATK